MSYSTFFVKCLVEADGIEGIGHMVSSLGYMVPGFGPMTMRYLVLTKQVHSFESTGKEYVVSHYLLYLLLMTW